MTVQKDIVLSNEHLGQANIGLFLDKPSCLPITIIACPQVRLIPDATGRSCDYIIIVSYVIMT